MNRKFIYDKGRKWDFLREDNFIKYYCVLKLIW